MQQFATVFWLSQIHAILYPIINSLTFLIEDSGESLDVFNNFSVHKLRINLNHTKQLHR